MVMVRVRVGVQKLQTWGSPPVLSYEEGGRRVPSSSSRVRVALPAPREGGDKQTACVALARSAACGEAMRTNGGGLLGARVGGA